MANSFEEIYETADQLLPKSIDIVSDQALNAIYSFKRLHHKQFHTMLEFVNNQRLAKQTTYVIYKQHYWGIQVEDSQIEYVVDLIEPISSYHKNAYQFVLNITGEYLRFNTMSPSTLFETLELNTSSDYLFFSFNYAMEQSNTAHQAIIMLDLQKKPNVDVYLVDPNGSLSYFDTVLGFRLTPYIEYLIKNFFEQLNEFTEITFSYKFINTWNPTYISINNTYDSNYIAGSGHCVVSSIILAHLISTWKCNPGEVYKKIKSMSTDEWLHIIQLYTTGLFTMIK